MEIELKALDTKKTRPTSWDELFMCGARDQIRTGDPHVGNVMLYQLSYSCLNLFFDLHGRLCE